MNRPSPRPPLRRAGGRPPGGPPGLLPRRLMRTAKAALAAGACVAAVLALLPAPRGSEQFELAFADWRRGGAWYADDGAAGAPAPGAPAPGAPAPATGPVPTAPVLLAEAEPDPPPASGFNRTEPAAGPRFAALPAGRAGRLTDSPAAPLRPAAPVSEPLPESRDRDAPDGGPVVPPPDFADLPAASAPDEADDRSPGAWDPLAEALRGLREEVHALRDEVRDLRGTAGRPEPPGRPEPEGTR